LSVEFANSYGMGRVCRVAHSLLMWCDSFGLSYDMYLERGPRRRGADATPSRMWVGMWDCGWGLCVFPHSLFTHITLTLLLVWRVRRVVGG
jgi:hypothetical protein